MSGGRVTPDRGFPPHRDDKDVEVSPCRARQWPEKVERDKFVRPVREKQSPRDCRAALLYPVARAREARPEVVPDFVGHSWMLVEP